MTDLARPPTPWAAGGSVPLCDLFVGFLRIGVLGFGGVATIARHEIIERRGWLNDQEYAAVLGLGKVLPGANTVNAAVMIGDRFQGAKGAIACVFAIMTAPVVIAVLLTLIYAHFSSSPLAQAMMGGAAAAAAGMVIGTAIKMAAGLKRTWLALLFGVIALVAVGVFKVGLLPAVVILGPVAVVATAYARRDP